MPTTYNLGLKPLLFQIKKKELSKAHWLDVSFPSLSSFQHPGQELSRCPALRPIHARVEGTVAGIVDRQEVEIPALNLHEAH